MIEIFGKDQHVVFARELTKIYEQTLRGSLEEISNHFAKTEPKGEFVILL
jgi:16S rRNA (cytidine1402-2'-O)-methyltransferase